MATKFDIFNPSLLTIFFLSAVKNSNFIPVALSLCTEKLMRSSIVSLEETVDTLFL